MNLTMETFKNIWAYSSPIILIYVTYLVATKGKRKDIDITKEQKLNIVLSDLLSVWFYLSKLEDIIDVYKSNLSIPKKAVPYLIFKSRILDNSCFDKLEKSIELLKSYDPVCHFDLHSIGRRFEYIKSNLILPFLTAADTSRVNEDIANRNIGNSISDLEEYLIRVSKLINRKTYRRIKKRIDNHILADIKSLREEIVQEYNDVIASLLPDEPTKDQEFNVAIQEVIEKHFDTFMRKELKNIIKK